MRKTDDFIIVQQDQASKHKRLGWLQPWEDCQAKSVQEREELYKKWTGAGVNKSHHAQTSATSVSFLVTSHSGTRDNI